MDVVGRRLRLLVAGKDDAFVSSTVKKGKGIAILSGQGWKSGLTEKQDFNTIVKGR